ncbi:MAG: tryptophan--tRNA ligase [Nitrospinae bacterium]|nr:tryptophan--tRNA ligase [Nitrospinota bacterium]
MEKKRVLSGMQASGRLHLGNLLGALENWRKLQDEYDCFYFIADWHALSTSYEDTHEIKDNVFNIAIDWLAAGIDPEKSTVFLQSLIPEHAVLHLLLSMITPVPWLERNPTYKEKMQEVKDRDLTTYGFLGYPVLQAADIIIYKANYVPVGIDQLPHLEVTREIVRRFHFIYKKNVFVEPEPLISEVPKLPGLDNRKMSKSYGNAIFLSDSPEAVTRKVRTMITDPQRVKKTDTGNPEICSVFTFHKIFSSAAEVSQVYAGCTTAGIGCTDCKLMMARNLNDYLKPISEKRKELLGNPGMIYDILQEGSKKAQSIARQTLSEVNEAMGLYRAVP